MRPIEILQERLTAKLSERNVTAREVALAATGQPSALRNILGESAMPKIDRLDAIAADWLLGRENAIERTIAPDAEDAIKPEIFRGYRKTY